MLNAEFLMLNIFVEIFNEDWLMKFHAKKTKEQKRKQTLCFFACIPLRTLRENKKLLTKRHRFIITALLKAKSSIYLVQFEGNV
jgi:hypothetical protein